MSECRNIYRPTVRIGNWFEDVFRDQEHWRSFCERRACGKLCIQIREKLNGNLLKPVDLTATVKNLQFGAIVQVLTADACSSVSLTVRESDVDCTQEITESSEVTLAPGGVACVRNSFKLVNPENFEDSCSFLKFGQNFLLKCVEQPLFLYSAPKSIAALNGTLSVYAFKTHGDIHQGLGLCWPGCSQSVMAYCKWRCEYPDPDYDVEFEGQPVPKNTSVIIKHSLTNMRLAAEKCEIDTLFGKEYGITVHNYKRNQKPQNLWMLNAQ